MPTMQVLLSITFNLDFKTAKFLHLKIIKNNTFSGAASLGGLHVARKCGAVCACEPRCGCIFATHKGRNNESLPLSWGTPDVSM